MQAILVLRVYGFDNILSTYGSQKGADIVFKMRSLVNKFIDVFRQSGDMVITVLPSVQEAIDRGQEIMNTLAIPMCGAIGYGSLYRTVDKDYWGLELNKTITLSSSATLGSILLTEAAQVQIPGGDDSCPL